MSLTLVLHDPPLIAEAGTNGAIEPLSQARGRSMGFDLAGSGHELSFTLPGRHYSNALIRKGATDVVAYWGDSDAPLMRFRVTHRNPVSTGGQVAIAYRAVSYKALLAAWVFHDTDQRSWTATAQSLIAWEILNQGQAKARGNLGVVRGTIPSPDQVRDRIGTITDGRAKEYYASGQSRFEAIQQLSEVIGGFDWDITPHPTLASTSTFDVWSERGSADDRLELVDGSTIASWSMDDGMAEFANVTRTQGREASGENVVAAAGLEVWRPATKSPVDVTSGLGRWEESFSSEAIAATQVTEDADANLVRALNQMPGFSLSLKRGVWAGPSSLWLGDTTLLNIQVLADNPASEAEARTVDYYDAVRVLGMKIDVDEEGNEDVSLQVGRPARTYPAFRRELDTRLKRLERR